MLPILGILPAAPLIVANSISYTTPGSYSFTCPEFNTLTATTNAAGGGGGSFNYINGATFVFITGNNDATDGGNSSVFGLTAVGGSKGIIGSNNVHGTAYSGPTARTPGANGADGTASGGDTNTTGGGAAGGLGGNDEVGMLGGKGGNGGKAVKTYAAGDLQPGQIYTVVVGAGGNGETQIAQTRYTNSNGHIGTSGNVSISWS